MRRALGLTMIRAPTTVGKKWSIVVATTNDTNPTRLSHAWAGLIWIHAPTTGAQPETKSVARLAPTATSPSATR